jgi:NAD(P)-dependent dehydrogenase (short-subunit alcohol dehydrogenase family)
MLDWATAENRADQERSRRKPVGKRGEAKVTVMASQRDLKQAVIENPYLKGEMETAIKRTRDPLDSLHRQGKLDDAQLKAALILRRTVERMGTRINSVNPERIRVDGGKKADPALYILEGAETLRTAQKAVESALGKEGWAIVRRVAAYGEGLSVVGRDYALSEADLRNDGISREAKTYVSRTLLRGLEHAARALGV